ncbi:MAG: hypothetical protein J2P52_08095 [Blastocatellia bacterium]|nr:hypothetical protein [Blastocatellia bacterium]
MMRITQHRDGEAITLKIEGRLTGEWVDEMERCWNEVKNDTHLLRIDLTGVTCIDAAGRELLARMFASGAAAVAVNVMTRAVIEQITNNLWKFENKQTGGSRRNY